jgi:O-antigen/teichoic acid export membrane protein
VKNIVKKVVNLYFWQSVAQFLTVVFPFYLTYLHGIGVTGAYALTVSIAAVFGSMSFIRIDELFYKYLSEYKEKLLSFSLNLIFIYSLLITLVILIFNQISNTVTVYALYSLSYNLTAFTTGYLVASGSRNWVYKISIFAILSRCVILWGLNEAAHNLVLYLVLSDLVFYVIVTLIIVSQHKIYFLLNDFHIVYRKVLSFTVQTWFSSTLKTINQQLETILVGGLFGERFLGSIVLIKKLIFPLSMVVSPLPIFFHEKLSRDQKAGALFVKCLIGIYVISVLYSFVIISMFHIAPGLFGFLVKENEINKILIYLIFIYTSLQVSAWWYRVLAVHYKPSLSIRSNIVLILITVGAYSHLAGAQNIHEYYAILSIGSGLLMIYWIVQLFKWRQYGGT